MAKKCVNCEAELPSKCVSISPDIDIYNLKPGANLDDVLRLLNEFPMGNVADSVQVKVNNADNTPGFLQSKLQPSQCITFDVVNAGGNSKIKMGINMACILDTISNTPSLKTKFASMLDGLIITNPGPGPDPGPTPNPNCGYVLTLDGICLIENTPDTNCNYTLTLDFLCDTV